MNLVVLRDEITLDPNTVGYAGMSDSQVADSLNAQTISVARTSIPGSELFGYTHAAEYALLTDVQKQQWLGICGIETLTQAAIPLVQSVFDNGTTTWANIVKTKNISRAEELGLGPVNEGDVAHARAL